MSGDSMLIAYRLIQSLWPPFTRPRRYARMVGQVARGEQRFYTIHSTLPDDLVVQHLLGLQTYAAPLIGLDGQASAWAIDIDTGGPPMLIVALIAAERSIQAFAITLQYSVYNGD